MCFRNEVDARVASESLSSLSSSAVRSRSKESELEREWVWESARGMEEYLLGFWEEDILVVD